MTTDAYKLLMSNVGAEDPLYEKCGALQSRIPELDTDYDKAYGMLDKASTTAGRVSEMDPIYAKSRGLIDTATGMAGRVSELDPIYQRGQGILAETAGPWNPTPYLNPYTEEVEKRSYLECAALPRSEPNGGWRPGSEGWRFRWVRLGCREGRARIRGRAGHWRFVSRASSGGLRQGHRRYAC
jgi:hypothetical protein